MADVTPSPEPNGRPLQSRRGYQLALLVLLGSLLMVALYAQSAGERERQLAEADFVAEAEQVVELLRQRLVAYELTAHGGVSLFASVSRPSARQWRDYVDGLRLERRSFGLLALGYAAWLTPQELEDLQLEVRANGGGLYRVSPHGAREHYGPVVYLEPETPENLAAVGYDMYTEPMRRAAMEAARDEGVARLSAGVGLLQDRDDPTGPGLLLYMPVYRAGSLPASASARHRALQGWVYVPFRVDEFVQSALASLQRTAVFRIVDTADETVLYADSGYDRVSESRQRLRHEIERDMYGRHWRIDFRSAPAAARGLASPALQATLVAGLLASLLLFAVVWTLARTHSHAERLAARLSESYRRSESRFRSSMQYSAIGKALLDRHGRVVEANPALARILGTAPSELPGTTFGERLIDPAGMLDDEAADADGVVRTTREVARPDGELRHVQLTYSPVPGDLGTDVVRLVQVEDVTERQRAEAQVHALNRMLEMRVAARTRELRQANQELESFAYSISHDLRAPLRTIDGFGRMLAERYRDQIDDAGRDYLDRIRAATVRMDGLIDALLKMSRLTRGELKRVPLDLSRMSGEIVAELRESDPEREVEVVIAPDLYAHGDSALVRNLLENLIGNAWKFTAGTDPARIEISAARVPDGGPAFSVCDNGAGFAQEYAGKLFRPFQRLHKQEEFSGNGIGLASVKRIVDRHGGEVWAEGRPGQGACFRFTLPSETAVE